MNYEIVNIEEKMLVGICEKTSNSDEKAGEKIGGLWAKFLKEEFYKEINAKSKNAICLYSDYKNTNVAGNELEYEVTIGLDAIDENKKFITKIIPAGKYAKFLVEGDVTEAVMGAWTEIWEMNLDRSYTGDFEEYLNESMEDVIVAVYVALN